MAENRDFPGGPVVKNPPSNGGDAGLISGRGIKISHAMGHLSPCATTTELTRLNERARVPQITEPMHHNYLAHTPWSPRVTAREKPTHHNKEPSRCNKRSRMPQRGSRMLQLRPDAAKKEIKKKNG